MCGIRFLLTIKRSIGAAEKIFNCGESCSYWEGIIFQYLLKYTPCNNIVYCIMIVLLQFMSRRIQRKRSVKLPVGDECTQSQNRQWSISLKSIHLWTSYHEKKIFVFHITLVSYKLVDTIRVATSISGKYVDWIVNFELVLVSLTFSFSQLWCLMR